MTPISPVSCQGLSQLMGRAHLRIHPEESGWLPKKPLSDNSNICVTLVLASVDCVIFKQAELSLVLAMMSDF